MGILQRQYLHTLSSNLVLKFVVGLVISIATARALGPEGRGEFNLYVLIITTAATLMNFGIPASNTYFAAQKSFTRTQLVRSSLLFAGGLGILGLLAFGAIHELGLSRFLFPIEKLTTPVVLALGILPLVLLNLFIQGILVGEKNIVLSNNLLVSSQGFLAIMLLTTFLLGWLSVPWAIGFYAMSQLLLTALLFLVTRDSFFEAFRFRLPSTAYRTIFLFSTTIHLGNLTQFMNYRLDAFIVYYFLGTEAVGYYGLAATLAEILWILSTSMAAVLLPTIAGGHRQSREIVVKAAVVAFGSSCILGLVAFLAGPSAIEFLFGTEFIPAILPFLVLIPGVVVFSLNIVVANYMTGIGQPRFNVAIAIFSFLLTVIFDILLIPSYGIVGASYASVIAYTTSSILAVAVFLRLSRITYGELVALVSALPRDLAESLNRLRG